jgi:quinol monooxygenase YgiN
MSLRVIATMRAQPGREIELRDLLVALIHPTREEDGCIGYRLLENRDDPAEFAFIEEWSDDVALDAHFETPHLEAAIEKMPELLAGEMDIRKYELIG